MLLAALMITGAAVPVFAETITFDVTIPGDFLSRRALKADSEQKFYVSATSFNKPGALQCTSYNLSNSSIYSYMATIRPSKLSDNKIYRSTAPAGQYYYMSTWSATSGLHVTGRYTP